MSNDDAIQLELLPTGKSERALSWRNLILDHAKAQEKIYKALYGSVARDLKADMDGSKPLSTLEKKQIGDLNRGAGSWLKQVSEALQIAEQSAQEAIDANSWHKPLEEMTEEELDAAINSYV